MLPHEIDPFAEHHIKVLIEIARRLEHDIQNDTFTLTKDEALVWHGQLTDASRALIRFKVCMNDEVMQKERYAEYAKNNGYPYS